MGGGLARPPALHPVPQHRCALRGAGADRGGGAEPGEAPPAAPAEAEPVLSGRGRLRGGRVGGADGRAGVRAPDVTARERRRPAQSAHRHRRRRGLRPLLRLPPAPRAGPATELATDATIFRPREGTSPAGWPGADRRAQRDGAAGAVRARLLLAPLAARSCCGVWSPRGAGGGVRSAVRFAAGARGTQAGSAPGTWRWLRRPGATQGRAGGRGWCWPWRRSPLATAGGAFPFEGPSFPRPPRRPGATGARPGGPDADGQCRLPLVVQIGGRRSRPLPQGRPLPPPAQRASRHRAGGRPLRRAPDPHRRPGADPVNYGGPLPPAGPARPPTVPGVSYVDVLNGSSIRRRLREGGLVGVTALGSPTTTGPHLPRRGEDDRGGDPRPGRRSPPGSFLAHQGVPSTSPGPLPPDRGRAGPLAARPGGRAAWGAWLYVLRVRPSSTAGRASSRCSRHDLHRPQHRLPGVAMLGTSLAVLLSASSSSRRSSGRRGGRWGSPLPVGAQEVQKDPRRASTWGAGGR